MEQSAARDSVAGRICGRQGPGDRIDKLGLVVLDSTLKSVRVGSTPVLKIALPSSPLPDLRAIGAATLKMAIPIYS